MCSLGVVRVYKAAGKPAKPLAGCGELPGRLLLGWVGGLLPRLAAPARNKPAAMQAARQPASLFRARRVIVNFFSESPRRFQELHEGSWRCLEGCAAWDSLKFN